MNDTQMKTHFTSLKALVCLLAAGLLFTACNKQPIGPTEPDPTPPASYLSIANFRALYTGSGDVFVPTGTGKIRGVVISNSANEAAGNYRIQDESGAGIYLYAANGSPVYPLGTVLQIDASGVGVLTLYNGDLELMKVPSTKVTVEQGATLNITPRVATAQEVISNLDNWASTLVTLNNVTITKSGAANGTGQNYNITDATGTLVSFVRTASNITLPEGGAGSITGYVSIFQSATATNPTPQLIVRSAADVVNGGQGGGNNTGSGISLGSTSPFVLNFDNIGTALPTGVSVATSASATSAGTAATFSTANTALWRHTNSGFKNFASATGLAMNADSTTQANATNRALGVRQTSSFGDPGAAFVFQINNTTGKNNLKMDFLLQSLDTSASVSRTATWSVDYAIGDNPTAFTPLTPTGTLTTGNKVFAINAVSVTLPAAANNQAGKLWIRVLTLAGTSGSSNRPSTAIDDVKFSWN